MGMGSGDCGRVVIEEKAHGASSLGWSFPALKCKYIFQIEYIEAVLSNSTRKLLWFEITKMLIAA